MQTPQFNLVSVNHGDPLPTAALDVLHLGPALLFSISPLLFYSFILKKVAIIPPKPLNIPPKPQIILFGTPKLFSVIAT